MSSPERIVEIQSPQVSVSDAFLQLDPDQFHDSLAQGNYAPVPTTITQTDLAEAARCFLEFLALPESIRHTLHFPAERHRATADGYTDRTVLDDKDAKVFFHWTPTLKDKAPCQSLRTEHPEIDRFFHAADAVYRHAEASLHAIYSQCLPEFLDRLFQGDRLIDGTLRFLCYTPDSEEAFCAQAHYDKGFSTLALADSAPGLRIGTSDAHPLLPVQHHNQQAIFMPAWMLFQASDGRIKPAWHDVVHEPGEQNVNELCARWSIVFFVNDPEASFSSWDTVHTPLH